MKRRKEEMTAAKVLSRWEVVGPSTKVVGFTSDW